MGCDAAEELGQQQAPSLMAALPPNALATILHKAGPHTRQVCRAFHAAHPPVLSLGPHGLPTPAALTAALAALPRSVTALDLRRLSDHPFSSPLTPAHLATICARLPRLRTLVFPPSVHHDLFPAIYTSLARLPHLATLTAPPPTLPAFLDVHDMDPAAHPPYNWAPLHHPPLATRLRSLALTPSSLHPLLAARPPATLPHLTALSVLRCGDSLPAAHFAALAAAAPALQSLHVAQEAFGYALQGEAPLATLAALTALTTLSLQGVAQHNPGPTGHEQPPAAVLLQHIGRTLTTLRSLSLTMDHRGWTPAEAGWLSRLTRLTQLDVQFCIPTAASRAGLQRAAVPWASGGERTLPKSGIILASVARDVVACLPLLHDLQLGLTDTDSRPVPRRHLGYASPECFLRHLAAATQLRRLCLQGVQLPPGKGPLLAALQQHLTSLRVTLAPPPWIHNSEAPLPAPLLAALEQHLASLSATPATPPLHGREPGLCSRAQQQGASVSDSGLRWLASLRRLRDLALTYPASHSQVGSHSQAGYQQEGLLAPYGDLDADEDELSSWMGTLLLPPLTSLRTLSLTRLPACHDLAAVLAPLQGTLVHLHLAELHRSHAPALSVLRAMGQLRALDLCHAGLPIQALELHLRLPASLRRCWLGGAGMGDGAREQWVGDWRQRHPLVVFRLHPRPDPLVW